MSRKKKGQSSALTTCSKFYMQAMFEVISIVVFLFISTKAADRLPRDPKENGTSGGAGPLNIDAACNQVPN